MSKLNALTKQYVDKEVFGDEWWTRKVYKDGFTAGVQEVLNYIHRKMEEDGYTAFTEDEIKKDLLGAE